MINFPNSPAVNDTFTVGDNTYIWDGEKWKSDSDTLATVAVTADYDDMSGTPRPNLTIISSNTTLALNESYGVDFTSPRNLTLPPNAALDDVVYIYNIDGDSSGSTILQNGTQTIMGIAEDMDIDYNITVLKMAYSGSTWIIASS